MHPFGGTPICPRCSKSVYAAEQIMGPGRRLYHKPCLACMTCGKRLDSYNLVEHDQEPYCKTCHVKNFGTRDLRHANLPDRDDVLLSPPTSPTRTNANLPPPFPPRPSPSPTPPVTHATGSNGSTRTAPLPIRRTLTGNAGNSSPFDRPTASTLPASLLKPTRALSPTRGERGTITAVQEEDEDNHNPDQPDLVPAPAFEEEETVSVAPTPLLPPLPFTPTHTGRSGVGNLPRTVPLSPTKLAHANSSPTKPSTSPPLTHRSTSSTSSSGNHNYTYASVTPQTPVSSHGTGNVVNGRMAVPLIPTSTGTRYGAALGGKIGSPAVKTPTGGFNSYGSNPVCSRCQKTVYFAEQVKAVGKTWHKGCLRCMECNSTLDSSRLTEREGDPFCHRCYGKLYGPQGSGYALLGKTGG
ncbi:hypothetical protein BXZ70DRAFT_563539 [Cristinia sonorae]|uniref:Cysteine-rich protein 1 n=1 Tax=Cristinia sonorae TaxID=1940300 RepID=A0A8K0UHM8_9AGAR|nr:hypothetical protein BXZ70DRAFT_563539 [Cristinia sonorae]